MVFGKLLLGVGAIVGSFVGSYGKIVDCSSANAKFSISSLSFSPDPPVRNAEAVITMIYSSYTDVSAGKVDYSVTLNGIPAYSEHDELCDQTSCPINVGIHNETSVFTWPDVSGKVVAKTIWYDESGAELLCFQTSSLSAQNLRGSVLFEKYDESNKKSYSMCLYHDYLNKLYY
jgi:hypothetical protein